MTATFGPTFDLVGRNVPIGELIQIEGSRTLSEVEEDLQKQKGDNEAIQSQLIKEKEKTAKLKSEVDEFKDEIKKLKSKLQDEHDKLTKEEDQVTKLKIELKTLQKKLDTGNARHERELNRTKLANQKVIDELKLQNENLVKNWQTEAGKSTGLTSAETSTLEADDSKTDTSLTELHGTPLTKKGRGRGRGRDRAARTSNASLASFEDSNTENDPEVGKTRNGNVSRKARVTRNTRKGRNSSMSESHLDMDNSQNQEPENSSSGSRKRRSVRTSASEKSVKEKTLQLPKEKTLHPLSPVPENQQSGDSTSEDPEELRENTPGSIVKNQLGMKGGLRTSTRRSARR